MRTARWRLACLWVSQTARVMADSCLGALVLLAADLDATVCGQVIALILVPRVVLSPVIGALCNGLPKRGVLVVSAGFALGVVSLFALLPWSWLWCWGLVALATAFYRPACDALLPAGAEDAGVPLPRLNAWFEMGSGAALLVGIILGSNLFGLVTAAEIPAAVGLAIALYLLGFLAAWPVWFPSDLRRRAPAVWQLIGFGRDALRALKNHEMRQPLLAMACLKGLVVVTAGLLLATVLGARPVDVKGPDFQALDQELTHLGLWTAAGFVLGALLARVQSHPWRSRGLVAYGATGLFVGLGLAAMGGWFSGGLCLFLGMMVVLVNAPLAAAYQANLPADARGNGMALRLLAEAGAVAALSGIMYSLADQQILTVGQLLWLAALLGGVFMVLAWRWFFREAMEVLVECLAWSLYRIRARGPGLDCFPREGPVLIISNHSAWLDPIFIAKVLPRRLTAMMTSQFYDKPLLRWFSKHVVHAIRVQVSAYRREAPELAKAISALDKGEAVLIFPEGAMRRRESLPLKLFGQGVWHILSERPRTRVVVCWIEGNWGCYFSYFNGPPTVNKRMDFWRRIEVGVDQPQLIDEALLGDQRATRKTLMRMCLEARRFLNLEPLRLDHGFVEQEMGEETDKAAGPTEEKATRQD